MADLYNRQFASLCVVDHQWDFNFPSRYGENPSKQRVMHFQMEVRILIYLGSVKDIRMLCDVQEILCILEIGVITAGFASCIITLA